MRLQELSPRSLSNNPQHKDGRERIDIGNMASLVTAIAISQLSSQERARAQADEYSVKEAMIEKQLADKEHSGSSMEKEQEVPSRGRQGVWDFEVMGRTVHMWTMCAGELDPQDWRGRIRLRGTDRG